MSRAAPPDAPLPVGSPWPVDGITDAFAFRLGAAEGAVGRHAELRILALDRRVEVVESEAPGKREDDVLARWGPPSWRVVGTGGVTLVYPGFGFDLQEGAVVRTFWYSPRGEG